MAVEELTIRATMRDELSRPMAHARREVDETTRSMRRLERQGDVSRPLGRTRAGVLGLRRELGGLDTGLRTTSAGLGRLVTRGLAIGAAGFGALGAAAGVFGLKAASGFEQARISFDGFLGSAAAGEAMFERLRAFNLKTPFELPDLTGGAKMLLGFGFAGESVLPILKSLTNAAAGLGVGSEGLQRMVLNLGQVRAAGVVTGRELRDFATMGFPGYELVGQILGKTREEIRAMGDDAQVSADDFIAAVIAQQGVLSRFQGQAEAQAHSLAGLWSNLKDQLTASLATAAEPLVEDLKAAMPVVTELLGGLLDAVGPPLIRLGSDLANVLIRLLPQAEPLLSAIATGLGRLLEALVTGADAGPAIAELSSSLLELVDELVPVMPDLADAFIAFVMVLPELVRLLADLVPLTAPILRLITGLLGIEPVRKMAAGLLLVLLGYRALSGLAGTVLGFARAILALGQAQAIAGAETAAAGGAGGAARGGIGVGRLAGIGAIGGGLAMAAPGVLGGNKRGAGDELSTIGGFAAAGAGLGSIIPGAGTVVGGLLGAGVGAIGVLGRNAIARRKPAAPVAASASRDLASYSSATNVAPGGIVVYPQSDIDLERALPRALEEYERDRAERGPSRRRT